MKDLPSQSWLIRYYIKPSGFHDLVEIYLQTDQFTGFNFKDLLKVHVIIILKNLV